MGWHHGKSQLYHTKAYEVIDNDKIAHMKKKTKDLIFFTKKRKEKKVLYIYKKTKKEKLILVKLHTCAVPKGNTFCTTPGIVCGIPDSCPALLLLTKGEQAITEE